MRRFYVDYENVQSVGLEGLDILSDTDKVIVLYSAHADSMKIEIVKQLQESKAEITFVVADTGTANSLDFQLVAMLFIELSAEDEFFIVSKDTGFDAAIKMAKRLGHDNVKRIKTLCGEDSSTEALPVCNDYMSTTNEILYLVNNQEVMGGSMFGETAEASTVSVPYAQIETIIIEKCGAKSCKKYGELIITGLRTSGNKNQFTSSSGRILEMEKVEICIEA